MRDLATQRQIAVLWATHLVEEIKVADRLVLLDQGSIRFDGALDEFMAQAPGHDLNEEVLRQFA